MKNQLIFDNQYLYQVKNGISHETITLNQSKIGQALTQIEQQILEHKLIFVNVLDQRDLVDKSKQAFAKISWAKYFVVVGIGGSDLGARAIKMALENDPKMEVIFHGDSTDPEQIRQLLTKIDLTQTIFNIISKSGKTIETLSHYLFLKNEVKQVDSQWQKHFIFTTSINSGLLFEESQKHRIEMLEIPKDLGGRFSVLSPVGFLPALAMGVDIDQLIQGAKMVLSDTSLARQLATDLYLLSMQGINLSVLMPYSIKLDDFARWYRQLFAESLGKNGVGIFPIQARGPADQHSQLQFYTQGPLLASILFVQVENFDHDYSLHDVDLAELKYLNGKKFSQIVHIEAQATADSLIKIGRPVGLLSLENLTPNSFGQLLMTFMLTVVFIAQMMDVNPFDQSGVEDSKTMIREKLSLQ